MVDTPRSISPTNLEVQICPTISNISVPKAEALSSWATTRVLFSPWFSIRKERLSS